MPKKLSRRDFMKLSGLFTATSITLACGLFMDDEPDAAYPTETEKKPVESPQQAEVTGEAEAHHQVIVVGGGIAGLTTAYFLQDEDVDVMVLESAANPGGRAQTGTYKGVHFARGTEYLGEPYGALRKIIKATGLKKVMVPDPMDAHFHDGKFYWSDDGLALMHIQDTNLRTFNRFVKDVMKMEDEYVEAPDFDPKAAIAALDEMIAREWFEQNSYGGTLEEAYNVAARGLFGANLDEISALSYIPEIAFDYEDAETIEDVEDLDNFPKRMGYDTGSYTFETGIAEVNIALADVLGSSLLLNATVRSVTRTGDIYLVQYQDTAGKEHSLSADVVVLAVPAPLALEIAPTVLDNERRDLMSQIPYSQYLTLALFSDTPIFNQAFDLAVPDDWFFTDIYDSTWVERTFNSSLPKDVWVAGVYIAPKSYKDTSLHSMDEQDVFERVMNDLEKVLPGARAKVTGYELTRFPYAYPVMVTGAYKRLVRLNKLNRGSLLLAGDYMIYPTFEAACDSGELAADQVLKEL